MGGAMDRVAIGLWQLEMRSKRGVEGLRKNGFGAEYHASKETVRDRVLEECKRASTIGFGGSLSIAELGIPAALEN